MSNLFSKNPWTTILSLSGAIGSFLILRGFRILENIDIMTLIRNPSLTKEIFSSITITSIIIIFTATVISGIVGFFIDSSKSGEKEYRYEKEQRVMHQIKQNRFFRSRFTL